MRLLLSLATLVAVVALSVAQPVPGAGFQGVALTPNQMTPGLGGPGLGYGFGPGFGFGIGALGVGGLGGFGVGGVGIG